MAAAVLSLYRCKADISLFVSLLRGSCLDPPRADDTVCLDAFKRVLRTCKLEHVAAQQKPDDAVCATATELDRMTKKVVLLFKIFFF